MSSMIQRMDTTLNRFTMYRLVLWVLAVLVPLSLAIAWRRQR